MWIRRRDWERLIDNLAVIARRMKRMEQELERLTQEVSAMSDVTTGAITLLDSLAQMIRDAADDPEQVRAVADQVAAKRQELADAVARNTPSDPNAPTG